jgi:predicted nucleic acid-binding Zn ribbon protein
VHHSMSEIGKIEVICEKCSSKMRKLLSMPTLIGFDEVGRSITKRQKAEKTSESAANKAEGTSKKEAA